jgi:hypothetical protein
MDRLGGRRSDAAGGEASIREKRIHHSGTETRRNAPRRKADGEIERAASSLGFESTEAAEGAERNENELERSPVDRCILEL